MKTSKPEVIIWTDGGCAPNPGPGGWGALLVFGEHERELCGGAPASTNNQMELTAAISALSALTKPCKVTLYTDSQYLRKGITEWMREWKRRGWTTASKQPVKNRDLWEALDALTTQHDIDWKWVKGHAGHEQNERVDRLAAAGRAKFV